MVLVGLVFTLDYPGRKETYDAHRHVNGENKVPIEIVGYKAADHRPERHRGGGGNRPEAHGHAAFFKGKFPEDNGHADGLEQSSAHALADTHYDEGFLIPRYSA